MKSLLALFILSILSISTALAEDTPATPTPLTDVEVLTSQNLELQMQVLQQRFLALQAQALSSRGLKDSEWTVNWPARRIEPRPKPQAATPVKPAEEPK